jgi:anti-sigma-K factor RskA
MTETCRDLRPLLGAYVLNALEADERALVEEHLRTCPACAAEYARLAPLPGLLTLAVPAGRASEEPLPPALEERLLDVVASELPRRRAPRPRWLRPRWRALTAATVVAAGVALAVVALATRGGGPEYGPEIPLTATAAPHGAWADAELHASSGGTTVMLHVSGLPGNPAAVYEVHCDGPDWSASAGTFRVDRNGHAQVVLTTAARQGEYDHIRVLRRTGGAPKVVFDGALS